MIDLEKGIIDFGVIKVDASTSRAEFDALSCDIVEKRVSKRGSALFVFKTPFTAGGVSMRGSVFFSRDEQINKSVEFHPYGVETNHQAFEASHKWLEADLEKNIDATDHIMVVDTEKVKVSSSVKYIQRDGMYDGGELRISFY